MAHTAVITTVDPTGANVREEGHPVFARATDSTGITDWHKCRFTWDFDTLDVEASNLEVADPRPSKTGNKNVCKDQEGFSAAYIYDAAGTYRITLTAYDPAGVASTATKDVTINASSRTAFHFDATLGDDTTGDGSSGNPYKTLAKAITLLANDTEMRFKRGETFADSANPRSITQTNVVFTDYGAGALPILSFTANDNGFGIGGEAIVLKNLDIRSGIAIGTMGGYAITCDTGHIVAVRDVDIAGDEGGNGWERGLRTNFGVSNEGFLVLGGTVGVCDGYHFWSETVHLNVIGWTAANSIKESVFRAGFDTTSYATIAWSDLDFDPSQADTNVKSCIRAQKIEWFTAYQNRLVNGENTSGFDNERCLWHRWDGNYFLDPQATQLACLRPHAGVQGLAVVNNVMEFNGRAFQAALGQFDTNNADSNLLKDVFIAHNTFIGQSGMKTPIQLASINIETISSVDAGLDEITMVNPLGVQNGNWLADGTVIQFRGSDLPAPLVEGTTYYIVNSTPASFKFKVAATRGGAAIDLTDVGSGTQEVECFVQENVEIVGNLFGGAKESDDQMMRLQFGSLARSENNVFPNFTDATVFVRIFKNATTFDAYNWTDWTALAETSGEAREDVPASALLAPDYRPDDTVYTVTAANGVIEDGVHTDYHGTDRPTSGSWFAGAVDEEAAGGGGGGNGGGNGGGEAAQATEVHVLLPRDDRRGKPMPDLFDFIFGPR